MLQLLDESIESLLRAAVPLDPGEIAVAFDAPNRQWAAAVSQPTVNVFLWNVQRDAGAARSGMETATRNSSDVRRQPLPRIQVTYVLSAWTTSHRDEHQLLGDLMLAVLANPSITPPHLKAPLDQVEPFPSIKLALTGASSSSDFWRAVDGQVKPVLELIVGLPVDPGFGTELAPPPAEISVATNDTRRPQRSSARRRITGTVDDPAAVGRVVRTRRGVGRVEEGGRYVVPGEPGDEVVLDLDDDKVVVVRPGEAASSDER